MSRTSQQWKRAQERLAAQGKALAPLTNLLTGTPSLANRIALLGQGACDCNTKSPDVHMHLPSCRYRRAMELADEVEVSPTSVLSIASAALSESNNVLMAVHEWQAGSEMLPLDLWTRVRDVLRKAGRI